MNYTIGYILYARQNRKEDSLPYLYQAIQVGCETPKTAQIYELIGDWYLEEFRQSEKSQKILAELALDAYARAYKIDSPRIHSNSRYFLKKAKEIFQLLHNSELAGFEIYLTNVMNTPFPNPATIKKPTRN